MELIPDRIIADAASLLVAWHVIAKDVFPEQLNLGETGPDNLFRDEPIENEALVLFPVRPA